jgi:hypothetical protein
MNFFKHWSWAGMFQVTWTITASTYGARFQNFCRRRLNLQIGDVVVGDAVVEFPETASEQIGILGDLKKQAVLNFHESDLIRLIIERDGGGPARLLYPVEVKVELPATANGMSFPVGFAWTRGGSLRFFRIQDHLRSMGLGRHALKEFISKHRECELNLADLPEVKERWFPNDQERKRFQILYDSIRADLGLLHSQQAPPPKDAPGGGAASPSSDEGSDRNSNNQGGDGTHGAAG